jgi:phage terminase small subunit
VDFARSGVIVPEPMTDILRDMIEVLKVIASDLEVIEQRIWKLENER